MMTPDLRPALKKYLQRFRKRLNDLKHNAGTEQVHAFRISCRELLANYSLFNTVTPAHRWRHTVRKALKSLNRLRDLQQMQERLADQPNLATALEEKLRKAEKRWRNYEPFLYTPGFLLSLSQTEKSLDVATKKSPVALPLLAKSYQRWKVVSQRVKKQLKKADAADLETLHRLRIRYKELRYLIELWIEADIPLSVDKKNLKEWQEILGEITDLRIMADIIRKIGLSPVIHLEFMLQAQKEAQKFLECREKFAQFLAEIEQQVEWYFNGKLP